jgi:hypothetical protein
MHSHHLMSIPLWRCVQPVMAVMTGVPVVPELLLPPVKLQQESTLAGQNPLVFNLCAQMQGRRWASWKAMWPHRGCLAQLNRTHQPDKARQHAPLEPLVLCRSARVYATVPWLRCTFDIWDLQTRGWDWVLIYHNCSVVSVMLVGMLVCCWLRAAFK